MRDLHLNTPIWRNQSDGRERFIADLVSIETYLPPVHHSCIVGRCILSMYTYSATFSVRTQVYTFNVHKYIHSTYTSMYIYCIHVNLRSMYTHELTFIVWVHTLNNSQLLQLLKMTALHNIFNRKLFYHFILKLITRKLITAYWRALLKEQKQPSSTLMNQTNANLCGEKTAVIPRKRWVAKLKIKYPAQTVQPCTV